MEVFAIAFCYTLLVGLLVLVAADRYSAYKHSASIETSIKVKTKMPGTCIVTFSVLFVLLNVYCRSVSGRYGGDLMNYYLDFHGRITVWAGFNYVLAMIRKFTSNFNMVIYITTFSCCAIALLAYKYSPDATPYALMLILSSTYIINTFERLKQSYSNAFAILFFVLISQKNIRLRFLLCLIVAIIASQFHVTGFLLILLWLFFLFTERNTKYTPLYVMLLFVSILFLRPIMLSVARLTYSSIPHSSELIMRYFGDASSQVDDNYSLSFLKNVSFYIVFAVGLFMRRKIKDREQNYDTYLFLTAVGAVLCLAAIQSYWFGRFSTMFVFPVSILFCILLKYMKKLGKQVMCITVVGSTLFLTVRSLVLTYTNLGGY